MAVFVAKTQTRAANILQEFASRTKGASLEETVLSYVKLNVPEDVSLEEDVSCLRAILTLDGIK